MLKYIFNLKQDCKSLKHSFSRCLMLSLFASVMTLVHLSDAGAQSSKKPSNTNSNTNVPSDEKKYDLLKSAQETIWTCENNVVVKTSNIGHSYLLLFNKKLFTMTGIEALNGVSHFTDMASKFDWFIIPGKAMLFDSKAGQRLLDYCQTPEMKNVKLPESNLMK